MKWLYDAQICAACGHGNKYPKSENKDALAALQDQNERYREALELIAGSSTDKLQVLQARAALDNIG